MCLLGPRQHIDITDVTTKSGLLFIHCMQESRPIQLYSPFHMSMRCKMPDYFALTSWTIAIEIRYISLVYLLLVHVVDHLTYGLVVCDY